MSQVTADFCKTEVVHWGYTSENAIFLCQDYKSKHTTGIIPMPSNNQSDPHHTQWTMDSAENGPKQDTREHLRVSRTMVILLKRSWGVAKFERNPHQEYFLKSRL